MSRLKDFAPALKHIADIIERGIREHPELSVGMQTEGIEVNLFQLIESKIHNHIKNTQKITNKDEYNKRVVF